MYAKMHAKVYAAPSFLGNNPWPEIKQTPKKNTGGRRLWGAIPTSTPATPPAPRARTVWQDHKRDYRVWNARAPVRPAHFGVAAGPGGIVPLPVAGWRDRVSGQGLRPPAVRV